MSPTGGDLSGRARPALIVVGLVWLAAVAVAITTAAVGGDAAHGYFAGWLVALSLPLGALPVLMVRDLIDAPETATASALRLMLAALPVLALLVVPALFDLSAIFPWPPAASGTGLKGFATHWYKPGFFGVRAIAYLAIWVVLSLFFVRREPPSRRHRTIAGAGLALHAVVGTLAAYDWWMSLDAPFLSSVYGLLVVTAQVVFALAVAALVAQAVERAAPERSSVLALLAVTALAAFVQVSQYLVIWSANLPSEIAWYQTRWVDALGPIAAIGLPALLALGLVLLVPPALAAMRAPALVASGALALAACLDLACLACPRGTFTFAGIGVALAFLVVVGGLGAICAAALNGRLARRMRHE